MSAVDRWPRLVLHGSGLGFRSLEVLAFTRGLRPVFSMFLAFQLLYEVQALGLKASSKLTPILQLVSKHKDPAAWARILGSHSMRANRPIVPDRATFTSFASHRLRYLTVGRSFLPFRDIGWRFAGEVKAWDLLCADFKALRV